MNVMIFTAPTGNAAAIVYFTNDAGQKMQRTRQIKSAFDFSKLWDRNIREQGFLRVAGRQSG